MIYDIIVVGAGPAGLTAAIYARRANKSVLILEKAAFGGQMTFSPKIENYPGFASLSGSELADKMVEQVLNRGTDVEIETVTGVELDGNVKKVYTEDGNCYEGYSVIIAAGAKHRRLGLPNEERFVGEGISFCAVCDGAFYDNKTVALIGGGNSALQEALLLSEGCKKVTIVQNLDFLTGEAALQELLKQRGNVEIILGTVVEEILDTPDFSGIKIKKVATGEISELFADGMFVAIGLEPENEPFANLVDLNDYGYVDAEENCLTKTPGIFVAGDCRKKGIRQVTTATADGATAAIAACRYLDGL